jgi:glycosyltransferase involved in cell wall biosynthesis
VCIEFAGLAPLARRRPAGGARWALTLHNLRSVMARHEAAVEPGARQRWLLQRDQAKAAWFEQWAMTAFDLVVVASEDDRAVLGDRALVVPNGVDTDAIRPTLLPAAASLVFTGALYTQPNVDGLVWFCEHVLPLVQAKRPDAVLAIVGTRPRPEVRALARQPGVHLHVDVPSVAPHLEAARVAVVPLRIGSGSRLKALEAMAAGRPVVGTAIGLGGIDAVPGVHALVADDAPAFAGAVLSLLDDDERASGLASAARELVERHYSWREIGAAYADALLA